RMLGKARADECVARVTGHLRQVMQPGGSALTAHAMDRLADAIVSIEYYMETLQAGRSDPWYMLDNAETALKAVDAQPVREIPVVAPAGADKQYTGTMVIGHGGMAPQPPALQPSAPPVLPVREKPAVADAGD